MRGLYTDSGVGAGLARLNAGIKDVEKASLGGSRAVNAVERGLVSLASQAAGITGPLGRIAEGLLKFGGGSALILGAAVGVGVIATAINAFEKDARDARQATEDLVTSIDKLGTHAVLVGARIKLGLAQGDVGKGQGVTGVLSQFLSDMTGGLLGVSGPEQSERRLRAVSAGQNAVATATQGVAEEAARAAKPLRELWEEIDRINDEVAQAIRTIPFFQETIAGIHVPTLGEIQEQERGRQVELAATKKAVDQISFNLIGAGHGFATPAVGPARKPGEKLDAAAIAAASLGTLGAVSQGGAGGILTAGGGLLTSLGLGVPGIVATTVGGLFNLFDHSQERRWRAEMDELRRIRENTDKRGQPDHINVQVFVNGKEVSGAILQDVMYGIRRAERRNAVPVLPPS